MKLIARVITYIITIYFFTSCCSKKSTLLKSYERIESIDTITTLSEAEKYVKISLFALAPLSTSSKTVFDLSDSGQGKLIESLASKTSTSKELVSSISSPIKQATFSKELNGTLKMTKRIVFNIQKVPFDLMDRIEVISIEATIPKNLQNKIKFVSWDKLATEEEIVDLGKISSTNTTSFSLSPEATLSGTIKGKLPGAYSKENSQSEERNLNHEFVKTNAMILNPYKFVLRRESRLSSTLDGNIVVEFTLESELGISKAIYEFENLIDNTTWQQDSNAIRVKKQIIYTPDFGDISSIPLDIHFGFRYRKILKNQQTVSEHDDKIKYIDAYDIPHDNKPILIDTREIKPVLYTLLFENYELTIKRQNEVNENTLLFEDYSKASEFLEWLKKTKNTIVSDYNLQLNNRPLTNTDISKLKISTF